MRLADRSVEAPCRLGRTDKNLRRRAAVFYGGEKDKELNRGYSPVTALSGRCIIRKNRTSQPLPSL